MTLNKSARGASRLFAPDLVAGSPLHRTDKLERYQAPA